MDKFTASIKRFFRRNFTGEYGSIFWAIGKGVDGLRFLAEVVSGRLMTMQRNQQEALQENNDDVQPSNEENGMREQRQDQRDY